MKYFITVFAVLAFAFTSCGGVENGYILKGKIANAGNLQVSLDKMEFDRTATALGKVACDADGDYKFEMTAPWQEGIYLMTIGAKKFYLMFDGKETVVEVNLDLNTLAKMEVETKGSETLKCYIERIKYLVANGKGMTSATIREQVALGCTPLMRAFLALQLYGASAGSNIDDFKKIEAELKESNPGTKYVTDFSALLAQVEQQVAQANAAEKIKVGEMAPDISLPGPDGKMHKLSSLRGKVVLLDFWASWCGPCRKSNPHVVEVYSKYKSKGFDVFSVSLDGADPRTKMAAEEMERRKADGKTKWIAAIQQDKLTWENHVSDLNHWGSLPAATYGVNSIPKTFLVGRDGKIVAINPRDNLEAEVQKNL